MVLNCRVIFIKSKYRLDIIVQTPSNMVHYDMYNDESERTIDRICMVLNCQGIFFK